MGEVRGQAHVKRALEVAAAGGHHILLSGPPQAGKTLLARTLPSILPATAVPYPFRAPEATLPATPFVGEATAPGELTLAHGGVLFLKNFHAFAPEHLAALRCAVEAQTVALRNGDEYLLFPAKFLLVATTLPCPCGFFNDPIRECTCSSDTIFLHQQHIKESSDTCFDLHIEVPRVQEDMLNRYTEERSAQIQSRVEQARIRQQRRYANAPHLWVNADLGPVDEVQHVCQMDAQAERLLKAAIQQLHLAPQSILRLQKVARTIADLAESELISANHLAEAIQYRPRF